MTLKVAYLCGEYPRATDTFIQREVAALREAGIDVETVSVRQPAASEQGTHEQEAERRRTRYLLPCGPVRLLRDHISLLVTAPGRYLRSIVTALTIRAPGVRALIYQLFYFAEAGMLAAHMRRNDLTHIHNHAPDASGYVTMLAAEMNGATFSMTIHGFGILSEPRRWRLKEKLERSAFVICVSWHARSQAMLWTDPAHWSRFHVVHCGIEARWEGARTHRGVGDRLLFVGRLDPVKGLPVLFDALGELRRRGRTVHLDIVGDGPERNHLEAAVRDGSLGDVVTFHGYRSQTELQGFLHRADVMVMTSFSEGIPVVLMEAMSRGLPVIAPRITGIPELVEDGVSGRLTTPARSEELADAISELLDDPAQRTQFARAAAETVEREFDLQVEARRLVEIMSRRLRGEPVAVRPELSSDDPAPKVHAAARQPAEALP